MKITAIASCLLFAAALSILVFFSSNDVRQAGLQSSTLSKLNPPEASPVLERASEFVTGLENKPASFAGTEPDGELKWDNDGNLLISKSIKDVFDYFLSAVGEEPLQVVVARLNAYITSQLPVPAAREARQLLVDYLAMKQALSQLPAMPRLLQTADIEDARRHLQQVRELRESYLTPEVAHAFYGDSNRFDEYMMARANLVLNQSLAAEQRQAHLRALQAELPQDMFAMLQSSETLLRLNTETENLQQQTDDAQALFELQASIVGEAAARRLSELEQQRQIWRARMQDWLETREAVLGNKMLAIQDRQELVNQQRREQFNKLELRRVLALENIHDHEKSQSTY